MGKSQERDFEWYKGAMPRLYRRYGRCWAVIRHRRVTSVHDTFGEACDMGNRTFGRGKFIAQQIGPDESAYTVSMPWGVA